MASKVRIELVSSGIAELLGSEPVARACEDVAQRIAQAAGDGFEVTGRKRLSFGGGRVGVGVASATQEARLAEAEDKALSKAVSRCRVS